MKTQKLRFLFTIILLVAYIAPSVEATSLTVYVQDSFDDAFILQNGNYFGQTPFLPLRSEGTNNILGTRFRNVNVPQGAKINNATLQVRTSWGYASAGDIRVTIAGDDIDDSGPFNDSSSFLRTYTHAFKVWNISEVNGAGWNYVDVTEIVQEIVDRVGWVSGNSLSLVYFTDAGTPRREFATIDNNAGYRPRINIFHSVEPTPDEVDDVADQAPGPFNDTDVYDWTKNDTYRGIDIYIVTELGPPSMVLNDMSSARYYNTSWLNQTARSWLGGGPGLHVQSSGVTENTASRGGWTFMIVGNNTNEETNIYWSDDEFQTWNKSVDLNDYYPFLTPRDSGMGAIWANQKDTSLMNFSIVWVSETDDDTTKKQVQFTTFIFDLVTEDITMGALESVTTGDPSDADDPDLYLQQDGTTHIIWQSTNGTAEDLMQYRRRQANGTWLQPVRVSSDVAFGSAEGDVVANEVTGVALVVWTELDVVSWDVQWDVVFPNNTVGTVWGTSDRQISTRRYVSVVNDRSTNIAHMVFVTHASDAVYYTSKAIDNTTAWAAQDRLDIGADRKNYPVIGFSEQNQTLAAVWWDFDDNKNEWNYWNVDDIPTMKEDYVITTTRLQYPHGQDYFTLSILSSSIWLVDPNGTLIGEVPDGTDPEDVIDDILGGAQPEDPQEEEYGPLNKFSWKLLVLITGMIMLVGSPIAGVAFGADTGTWIKLLYVMFFGIGLLWAIKSM